MSAQKKTPPPSSKTQKKKVTSVVTETPKTSTLPIETMVLIGSPSRIVTEIVLKDVEVREDALTEEILREEESRQAKSQQNIDLFDDIMKNSSLEVDSREYNYHRQVFIQTKQSNEDLKEGQQSLDIRDTLQKPSKEEAEIWRREDDISASQFRLRSFWKDEYRKRYNPRSSSPEDIEEYDGMGEEYVRARIFSQTNRLRENLEKVRQEFSPQAVRCVLKWWECQKWEILEDHLHENQFCLGVLIFSWLNTTEKDCSQKKKKILSRRLLWRQKKQVATLQANKQVFAQ